MPPDIDQCYIILGVRHGATPEELKQAYRDLVRAWHPDRLQHDARRQKAAEEKLKEINIAYERLQAYDPRAASAAAASARHTPPAAPRRRTRAGASAYGPGWSRATATNGGAAGAAEEPDEATLHARATAHFDEGRERFEAGDYMAAVSSLMQAVCIKPNVGDAYFLLGRAYTELRMPQKAASAFKQVVRFQPERLEAQDALARTFLAMNAPRDAVWTCSQVLKRRPNAVPLRVTLGMAYRQLGQLAQSLEALNGAVRADPKHAPAHFELGETHLAMGDREAARQVYAALKPLDADLAVQLLLSIVGG